MSERHDSPEIQAILARALRLARTKPGALLSPREQERVDESGGLEAALEAALAATSRRLSAAFSRFDLDGDGVVTVEEIQSILGLDRLDAEAFVAQFDRDGDEQVDYGEFLIASLARQGLEVVDDD